MIKDVKELRELGYSDEEIASIISETEEPSAEVVEEVKKASAILEKAEDESEEESDEDEEIEIEIED